MGTGSGSCDFEGEEDARPRDTPLKARVALSSCSADRVTGEEDQWSKVVFTGTRGHQVLWER